MADAQPSGAQSPQGARHTLSLSLRLFLLAAAWSLVALAAAAAYLLANYRQAAESGFETLLNLNLQNVISSVSPGEGARLEGRPELGDPRFNALHSGWYWQVSMRADPPAHIGSPSLAGGALALPSTADVPYDRSFRRFVELDGPNDTRLKGIEQLVLAEDTGDAVSYVVAGDLGVPERAVADFRNQLLAVFALLGFGLVAITVVQVQLGLRPLRAVSRRLADIREGRAQTLEGDYPREIAPLTRELNALIDSNAKIVERARMHVGNLAHALKTPLSVVTNEARAVDGPLAEKVVEQAAIMRHQVDYYLDRARMAARVGVVGAATDVAPVVAALQRAMGRIYEERNIRMEVVVPDGLRFKGERQDLEEMLGNLVDNAFKWAGATVTVRARALIGEPRRFELVVEDDGPGLSQAERAEALRRGIRLDETKPGSGLGLSIVGELAEVYEGTFDLGRSPKGGLRATLRLPAA